HALSCDKISEPPRCLYTASGSDQNRNLSMRFTPWLINTLTLALIAAKSSLLAFVLCRAGAAPAVPGLCGSLEKFALRPTVLSAERNFGQPGTITAIALRRAMTKSGRVVYRKCARYAVRRLQPTPATRSAISSAL